MPPVPAVPRNSMRNRVGVLSEFLGNLEATGCKFPARFQLAAWLASFAILLSRRPDAILNAQFWAEDGKFWFADAYNIGIRSLWIPEAGYFHIFPRLAAYVALAVPLDRAPLVMNLFGIAFQILPVG